MTEVTGMRSPFGSHDSILRVGPAFPILDLLFQFYYTPYTYVQNDIRDMRDFWPKTYMLSIICRHPFSTPGASPRHFGILPGLPHRLLPLPTILADP